MKTNSGFTLIELMIAISVLAIILGLGVPSLRDTIQNNRAAAVTNDLVTAMQVARSEATKRRQNIVVCRRNVDGDTCSDGTNWAAGWIVFADLNGDGDHDLLPAPAEPLIQVWDPPNGNPTLTASANTATFEASGRVSAARSFTITFPNCSGQQRRTVDISATGRVNTSRTACP